MSKELWKSIEGYGKQFQISSKGKVKQLSETLQNKETGQTYVIPDTILRPHINNGYLCINFDNQSFMIHRLVANAFVENPNNKPIVHFIDENKMNVDASNLEWITHSELLQKQNKTIIPPQYKGKPVKCIETSQVFESMKDAAYQTGLSYENISNSIYLNKTIKGYTFCLL